MGLNRLESMVLELWFCDLRDMVENNKKEKALERIDIAIKALKKNDNIPDPTPVISNKNPENYEDWQTMEANSPK